MRFLSLFSGIEAASVAWHPLGWTPVAFAEIEPFPCAVLEHHYPGVQNLGNVSEITKSQIEALLPIDVVVFGFPCQDLSVAGKREGLVSDDGTATRSGLFFDAMRIVEWSGARWSVAENVPGLFSSKGGRDFAAVVGTLAGVEFDVPPSGWKNIGVAAGPKGLVEWCVLDAQWFGLAQRRKRVFIVRDTGNWKCRPPLLFKSDSLSGDTAPSREAGKDVAATVAGGSRKRGGYSTDDVPAVACTLPASNGGASSGMQPVVAFTQNTRDEVRIIGGDWAIAGALGADEGMKQRTYLATLHQPVIPIDMRQASRGATMTNNRGADVSSGGAPGTGIGEPGDPSPSVSLSHPPAVAYQCHGSNVGEMGTLRAGNGNTAGGVPFTLAIRGRAGNSELECRQDGTSNAILTPSGGRAGIGVGAVAFGGDVARTLSARHDSSPCADRGQDVVSDGMQVRRLLPVECEKLQGFPPGYTDVPFRGKPAADGNRYKALGNSIAVPVLTWVGSRIQLVDDTAKKADRLDA